MSIQTNAILKSYFETLDKPTQAQFGNLIDTITSSNLKTIKYIVGVAGITGCNHNFTSVANTTEQSIQLGGTTVVPADSVPLAILIKCVDGFNGAITGVTDLGTTSGGSEFQGAFTVDDTNEFYQVIPGTGVSLASNSASSVYFSITPNANWNTITAGKWNIYLTYIDN